MYELKKFNIRQGVNLYYIEDSKYKTLSIAMYLHRPISREEVTKNSLLSGVLKSGTTTYPSMREINRSLEELYGTVYDIAVSRRGGIQSLVTSCSVVNPKIAGENLIPKAVGLILDFVFNPATEGDGFVKSYVETEKKNLKDNIESLVNDKRAYADFRCMEEMCAGESAGINEYGYVEDLEKIDAENLYEHYRSIITVSPIDIFVVGKCDIEDVKNAFSKQLEKIDFNINPVAMEEIDAKGGEVKNIEEAFDVAQGKLAMGFRTFIGINHKLYYPLLVGNSILGAGAHSKLFNNVREKSSLAYYVSSRLDKFSEIMLISSGIEFKNYERAKKEILEQVDDVKNGKFTDDELNISKDFIINQYRSYLDSPYMLRSFYVGQILGGKVENVDTAIENVRAVTSEQIVEAFSDVCLDTVYFLKGSDKNEAE